MESARSKLTYIILTRSAQKFAFWRHKINAVFKKTALLVHEINVVQGKSSKKMSNLARPVYHWTMILHDNILSKGVSTPPAFHQPPPQLCHPPPTIEDAHPPPL